MRRVRPTRDIARIVAGAAFAVAMLFPGAAASAQATGTDAAMPAAAPMPADTARAPVRAKRPKIGLVLSGGGARGLTHVGVLKVLEELRVPVDYVTATSMGAIVGGLYVSGMSAGRMEELVTSVDWPSLFSDQPPRRELSIRRKREDSFYTIPLEVGFRDFSLRFSTGALSGQNLEILLHGLTWRDDEIGSFDNLPIPFRAVSTSMVDGKPIVFDRGPLYLAMRGSMSVPGIFAPLEHDGKILGDGGLVNNLPVDLVKAMGADVVIAVNIGTPLLTREQLSSFIGVAEQSINILTEQNVRAQLALLTPRDVLIVPDLRELSALDFTKGEQFIELGEKAARAATDTLRRYSLPADAYAAYRDGLRRPPAVADAGLTFAGVRGTNITNPDVLQAQVGLEPGAKVDLPQAQADISVLYGRGDFDRIDYRLVEDHGIEFVVSEKPWGPNYLQFGVGLSSDMQGDNSFSLRLGHKRNWLNALGAQWTNDLNLGTTTSFATEFYQPLTLAQTLFAAAYASIGNAPLDLFLEGAKVAEYRVLTDRVGVDLGYALGTWGELRIGPQFVHQRAYPTVALPGFPVTRTDAWGVAALARADTQDNAFFPHRGLRGFVTAFVGTQRVDGVDRSVTRGEIDFHQSLPLGADDTVNLGLRAAGTTLKGSIVDNYRLGGFLELSGLRTAELQGPYLGRARAVYLHRMGHLPVIGNTYYAGGSLEIGNVWPNRDAIAASDTLKAGSVFVAADTPFGPLYLAWGHTTRGDSSWYLFLGRP
jgi:NTE family protein